MCQALREIMKDELEESKIEGKIEAYYEMGKTPEEIAVLVGEPIVFVRKVLNL